MRNLVIVLLTNLFTQGAIAAPSKPLLTIYNSQRTTFFCERPFATNGTLGSIDKVQWMRIVPLKQMARSFSCYQQKCINAKGQVKQGIACCQKDPLFHKCRNDLHNFVPETRLLKQQREKYTFAEFAHEKTKGCHFFVDKKNKHLEPAPRTRGMIARTYLYMKESYALRLSDDELQLYLKWHREYPVSEAERKRNEKIFEVQGNKNVWVR